jgi:curved DNA-binding protein CbpA
MSSRSLDQTFYQVLEIPITAAHHEIVAAYQRAKEAYAPDSPALYTMFTPEEAVEIRKLVEEAFLILGNQTKRREYDQRLLNRSPQPTAKDLPDFAPQKDSAFENKSTNSNNKSPSNDTANFSTSTVPDGFVKSRLSVYEVKPDLEKEIKTQTTFDGAFLRKIRQYKNINLDQLSKETRISRSYLAALESDDYEALPAPVFLRGFVIQVARMLGLDENAVASSYMSRIKKEI